MAYSRRTRMTGPMTLMVDELCVTSQGVGAIV
jgi:hypothetical protein